MSTRDCTAVRIETRILRIDAQPVAPGQHLHGEWLVQLEQAHVVERQSCLLEHTLRRRNRTDAHQFRLDPGEPERNEPHLGLEPELARGFLRGEEAGGCAVRQTGRVSRGNAAACAKRRAQRREAFECRVSAEKLVAVRDLPAVVREHAHRHDGLTHHSVRPRGCGPLLGLHGERIRVGLRDLREAVVQVLRGRAHRHR